MPTIDQILKIDSTVENARLIFLMVCILSADMSVAYASVNPLGIKSELVSRLLPQEGKNPKPDLILARLRRARFLNNRVRNRIRARRVSSFRRDIIRDKSRVLRRNASKKNSDIKNRRRQKKIGFNGNLLSARNRAIKRKFARRVTVKRNLTRTKSRVIKEKFSRRR